MSLPHYCQSGQARRLAILTLMRQTHLSHFDFNEADSFAHSSLASLLSVWAVRRLAILTLMRQTHLLPLNEADSFLPHFSHFSPISPHSTVSRLSRLPCQSTRVVLPPS